MEKLFIEKKTKEIKGRISFKFKTTNNSDINIYNDNNCEVDNIKIVENNIIFESNTHLNSLL